VNTVLDLAREFAVQQHGSQRYGKKPYIYHLDQVASTCANYNLSRDCFALAYLHDVYEDTETGLEGIRFFFGERMRDAVEAISNKTTFEATLIYVMKNDLAKPVKLVDRLCNMRESVGSRYAKKYIKQYPLFKAALQSNEQYIDIWSDLDRAYEELL